MDEGRTGQDVLANGYALKHIGACLDRYQGTLHEYVDVYIYDVHGKIRTLRVSH